MLDLYRSWKLGFMTREQAERKLAEPMTGEKYRDLAEDAVEETTAFDRAFKDYNAWLADQGKQCLPDGRIVALDRP